MNTQQLIDTVLASFQAEQEGDIQTGLGLIAEDFKVTDLTLGNKGDVIFPEFKAGAAKQAVTEVYETKGRKYEFINVIADESKQLVMVEFIESYPDPKTEQIYKTPQIAVCQVRDGKIHRTRHYLDPRTSFTEISGQDWERAYN
jgi:ketosteroid isomerase-like protein